MADGLNGSILNDGPLRLGDAQVFGGSENGINANVCFVEIYDHDLTPAEILNRWNDGNPLRGTNAAPSRVDFDTIMVEDAAAMQFTSEPGVVYRLQCTTDLVSSNNWEETGAFVEGDGGTLLLYDSTDSSSRKAYRSIF